MNGLLSNLEQLQYDARPIVYAALAFYSFLNYRSVEILLYCGVVLSFCCVYVLHKRFFNHSTVNIK